MLLCLVGRNMEDVDYCTGEIHRAHAAGSTGEMAASVRTGNAAIPEGSGYLGGHRPRSEDRARAALMAPPSCASPSPPRSFPTALYANHPPFPRADWPLPPHCEICKLTPGAPRGDWLRRPLSSRAPPPIRVVTGSAGADWLRRKESRARRGFGGARGKRMKVRERGAGRRATPSSGARHARRGPISGGQEGGRQALIGQSSEREAWPSGRFWVGIKRRRGGSGVLSAPELS